MPLLHDDTIRSGIEKRLRALTPIATPRWGKMSADQMLWHCSEALAVSVGERALPPAKVPLPRPVIKFVVLKLPWTKNAPTNPAFVAKEQHDFEVQRDRCLKLIGTLVSKPIDGAWPWHPTFGQMSGAEASQLHAKHLDHHLRQFGL